MHPALVGTLCLIPNALLGDTFPYGCCGGGSSTPSVLGTVYPDLGTPVTLGTFRHLSVGHNLGCSRNRYNLSCSPLFACRCGLGHSLLFFYHHTSSHIPVDIVPLPVATRPGAQYVEPVPLVDLTGCTHTGPCCVTWSYTTCPKFTSFILMWSDRG